MRIGTREEERVLLGCTPGEQGRSTEPLGAGREGEDRSAGLQVIWAGPRSVWALGGRVCADRRAGRCRGPAPAGSRGTLRMNGVGERETRRTSLDRAKSARERERERERPDPEYAAESGSCFTFDRSLYTLSWYTSKGQISIQTQFNMTSACPSRNQVCSVYFCL